MLSIQAFKLNNENITALTAGLLISLVIGLVVGFWGNFDDGQRILAGVTILMLSLGLMQWAVNLLSIKYLTIISLPYIFFVVTIFLPAFGFLPVDQANLPLVYRFPAGSWVAFENPFLLAVQIGMIMIPVGVLCANILFRFNRREIKTYFTRPLVAEKPGYILLLYRLFLFFSLIIVLYHTSKLKTIPLFYVLANPGQLMELALIREASLKLLVVPFPLSYFFAWTSEMFLPLATMLALKMYLTYKNWRWLLRFFLALGLMIFYNLLTGQKAPVVMAIAKVLLFLYLARLINMSWRTVFVGGLIMGLSMVAVLGLTQGYVPTGENFFVALRFLYYRLIEVPPTTLYQHFTIFPEQGEFLGGRTIRLWTLLTGQSYFNTAGYVNSILYPASFESGYVNTAYLGNAYTDFSFTGVIILSFLVGFVFHTIQIYILRREKNILNLALFAFISVTALNINLTDFPSTLLGRGIGLAVFLIAMIPLVFKRKYRWIGSQSR